MHARYCKALLLLKLLADDEYSSGSTSAHNYYTSWALWYWLHNSNHPPFRPLSPEWGIAPTGLSSSVSSGTPVGTQVYNTCSPARRVILKVGCYNYMMNIVYCDFWMSFLGRQHSFGNLWLTCSSQSVEIMQIKSNSTHVQVLWWIHLLWHWIWLSGKMGFIYRYSPDLVDSIHMLCAQYTGEVRPSAHSNCWKFVW